MNDIAATGRTDFSLPETTLANQAMKFAKRILPEFIYNHSIRSYLFGRALAQAGGLRPGSHYDDELVFISCMLHDSGLSDEGNGAQRFEVDGADLAASFLRDHRVEEERIDLAWDAIALHTSDGIAHRKGPVVSVTQLGIAADILGRERENIPKKFADQVHAAFPRENLGYALADAVVVQALRNPEKARPMTFPGHLLELHRPYGSTPNWYNAIEAAGWGDKPISGRFPTAGTPEELTQLFTDTLAAGNVDGVVSLFEKDGFLSCTPGDVAQGVDEIHTRLTRYVEQRTEVVMVPQSLQIVGAVAVMNHRATIVNSHGTRTTICTGTSTRRPDGTWRYVTLNLSLDG
ncbi:HD domain-containing protein [Nocardia carnea]|uniref:HD domain-containing protein n=1 Tax=Nocardia carnea TaxID=37328 RepID=UPI0024558BF4|nr:HD domain-containing protein [Nocardia carnea]